MTNSTAYTELRVSGRELASRNMVGERRVAMVVTPGDQPEEHLKSIKVLSNLSCTHIN